MLIVATVRWLDAKLRWWLLTGGATLLLLVAAFHVVKSATVSADRLFQSHLYKGGDSVAGHEDAGRLVGDVLPSATVDPLSGWLRHRSKAYAMVYHSTLHEVEGVDASVEKVRNFLHKPSNQSLEPFVDLPDDKMEIQRSLLRDCIDLFELLNATYMLEYGTLLGSFRHEAIIPWDDDLDVSVPLRTIQKVGAALTHVTYGFVQASRAKDTLPWEAIFNKYEREHPLQGHDPEFGQKLAYFRENLEILIPTETFFAQGGSASAKIFYRRRRRMKPYRWSWPFLDLWGLTFMDDGVHNLGGSKHGVVPVSSRFPLKLRYMPSLKREVLVPNLQPEYLKKYLQSGECVAGGWNHRTEVGKREVRLSCSELRYFFAFVMDRSVHCLDSDYVYKDLRLELPEYLQTLHSETKAYEEYRNFWHDYDEERKRFQWFGSHLVVGDSTGQSVHLYRINSTGMPTGRVIAEVRRNQLRSKKQILVRRYPPIRRSRSLDEANSLDDEATQSALSTSTPLDAASFSATSTASSTTVAGSAILQLNAAPTGNVTLIDCTVVTIETVSLGLMPWYSVAYLGNHTEAYEPT